MKKFFACTFIIMFTVAALFFCTGGSEQYESEHVVRIAEAAFSSDNTRFTDVTGFLVGSFAVSDGSEMSFSGKGKLACTKADGTVVKGDYSLAEDGEYTMMRIRLGRTETLYQFALGSAQGDIVLTGMDGSILRMTPSA